MSSPVPCLIGLGSNLMDSRKILHSAANDLFHSDRIEGIRMSSLWETDPVGGPEGQPRFLNAAALLKTDLDPFELLDLLHRLENRRHRTRSVHWGPRTLDLDLLIHGDQIVRTDSLIVPHPRLYWRSFALLPAAEIAPEMIIPTTGLSVQNTLRLLFWNTDLAVRTILLSDF
ncbi:MAG: 2-amino-4-hydroxy-6-hydroxymethyldihydropteridine diphosphokinase [Planctomycetia bacterium]|nr:2-amino-4-hydroxy-6-hydroxymethyldihydropteridine diphosphokinase [Planctomycetia bacterium]